jgi:hypothetical protein
LQRLNTALAATQRDIAEETTRLADVEGTLAEQQAALDARAAHLYQTSGDDWVTVLLGTRSVADLIARVDYLLLVSDSDAQLVQEVKGQRDQVFAVQQGLQRRQSEQLALQSQAQAQLAQMHNEIAARKGKLSAAQTAVAQLVKQQQDLIAAAAAAAPLADGGNDSGGATPTSGFSPNTIISDAKFLDTGSMSSADIQTFLGGQPGSLKSYSGTDHTGAKKTAAQMIADAAQAWHISPKVILVTLQKEQSLIANASPSQRALDWAMGCGKTDSATYTKYQGFGNQIWFGAKTLADHRADFQSGGSLSIDGHSVYPTNASTWSLYVYTPHFGGNTSFWTLYWRYFGDPG